jgi:hypothetical protein
MSIVYKIWLREPRKAWRNDGERVPVGFRAMVKRPTGKKYVVIDNPRQVVRKGHWVVRVGGTAYGFSPAEMRRLYSRVPL